MIEKYDKCRIFCFEVKVLFCEKINLKKMKRKIAIASLVFSMILTGCSKDNNPTPTSSGGGGGGGTTPPTVSGTFTWSEDGGTVITADSAFWTTGSWGTGIRAFKGGYANFFEINWATTDNISVGTKVIDAANYGFTFMKGSDTYTISTNQSLNITASASNKKIVSGILPAISEMLYFLFRCIVS